MCDKLQYIFILRGAPKGHERLLREPRKGFDYPPASVTFKKAPKAKDKEWEKLNLPLSDEKGA